MTSACTRCAASNRLRNPGEIWHDGGNGSTGGNAGRRRRAYGISATTPMWAAGLQALSCPRTAGRDGPQAAEVLAPIG